LLASQEKWFYLTEIQQLFAKEGLLKAGNKKRK
jgi:hypothetical protein